MAVWSNPRAASEDTFEFASAQGSFLGETLPPWLHLSFPSEALPFFPRCWEDSVNSSLEVLEALGGETHYKYPAFIISLPGGTVLHVGEANTCRGRKSKCRAPGALGSWLLGATWAGENLWGNEAPQRRTERQRPPGLAVGSNKDSGGWDGLLALLLLVCDTSCKSVHSSEPQFPHL